MEHQFLKPAEPGYRSRLTARRRRVSPVMSADAIAEAIIRAIVEDIGEQSEREVLLLVNGFGGTPSLELYLMYDAARRQCARHGLLVSRSVVGNYVTSLDMAGCSITVTLLEREIATLWDAPVHTAAMRHGM